MDPELQSCTMSFVAQHWLVSTNLEAKGSYSEITRELIYIRIQNSHSYNGSIVFSGLIIFGLMKGKINKNNNILK